MKREPLPEEMRKTVEELIEGRVEEIRKEILEGELGKLRREQAEQTSQIWSAIGSLTEELREFRRTSEENFARVWEAINSLDNRLEKFIQTTEANFARVWEAINSLDDRLERFIQTTEANFARVWEAINSLDNRLEKFIQTTESNFARVWETVNSLAEAQRQTEERLERFEKATQANFARVWEAINSLNDRLEKFIQTTEANFARVWEAINSLAEAQRRTEEALMQLARQVGHLTSLVGGELEVDAEELLVYALKQRGYKLLGDPQPFLMDGEVDVVVPVETPDGTKAWALVEAKLRVRLRELKGWLTRLSDPDFRHQLASRGVTKPYLPYMYGLRIYPEVEEIAEKEGIGLLNPRGEKLPARIRE